MRPKQKWQRGSGLQTGRDLSDKRERDGERQMIEADSFASKDIIKESDHSKSNF